MNGSYYPPFHQGHGFIMGVMHLIVQCNEAFAVKQILDLLQEKCALKKDERTMQTKEHFLRCLEHRIDCPDELSGAFLCKAILVFGTGFCDSHTFF